MIIKPTAVASENLRPLDFDRRAPICEEGPEICDLQFVICDLQFVMRDA